MITIDNLQWNWIEEVGDDEIHLINDGEIFIRIWKSDVLSNFPQTGHLIRWGEDDFEYTGYTLKDRWEEEKYTMVVEAWNKIRKELMNSEMDVLETKNT